MVFKRATAKAESSAAPTQPAQDSKEDSSFAKSAKGDVLLCNSHAKLEHDPSLKVSVSTSKDQCKVQGEIIKILQ